METKSNATALRLRRSWGLVSNRRFQQRLMRDHARRVGLDSRRQFAGTFRMAVTSLDVDRSGRFLAAASAQGALCVFDLEKPEGRHADVIRREKQKQHPQGQQLNENSAISLSDRTLFPLWKRTAERRQGMGGGGEASLNPQMHSGSVTCVKWHQEDASVLFSAGVDGTVKVWDAEYGIPAVDVEMKERVYALGLPGLIGGSPSCSSIACGLEKGSCAIVDLNSQGITHSLKDHKGSILDVAWLPGSSCVLATASSDKSVRLWDLRRARACLVVFDEENKDEEELFWWMDAPPPSVESVGRGGEGERGAAAPSSSSASASSSSVTGKGRSQRTDTTADRLTSSSIPLCGFASEDALWKFVREGGKTKQESKAIQSGGPRLHSSTRHLQTHTKGPKGAGGQQLGGAAGRTPLRVRLPLRRPVVKQEPEAKAGPVSARRDQDEDNDDVVEVIDDNDDDKRPHLPPTKRARKDQKGEPPRWKAFIPEAFEPPPVVKEIGIAEPPVTVASLLDNEGLAGGKRTSSGRSHGCSVTSLVFSRLWGGPRLFSSGRDGGVRVWDLKTGKRCIPELPPTPIVRTGRGGRGRGLVGGRGGWGGGQQLQHHHSRLRLRTEMCLDDDAGVLYVGRGSDLAVVDLWDTDGEGMASASRLKGHYEDVRCVVLNRARREVYTGGEDGVVLRWRLGVGSERGEDSTCRDGDRGAPTGRGEGGPSRGIGLASSAAGSGSAIRGPSAIEEESEGWREGERHRRILPHPNLRLFGGALDDDDEGIWDDEHEEEEDDDEEEGNGRLFGSDRPAWLSR
uniref:Anaphase-promoting complex subunit 4 WD40 domain-containing protein n=1 Tax=Chromera velia CCMP2878 TaxID=1169474 RepID=A0A0G4HVS1_9ALVE|eukprot:Cvel_1417.t1-p1 / transcript=Cvel_1417.t1 / gene=Cvel_1417 / organism=Chromera_velia_CCMP2878 / gene_product=DNA excision repair protein ERCC-8, putative / transcript_product=DNA excision repair protein ERCC-8, putative / location=Cvel_scaffold49:109911-116258(-) / protein_length=796 / sequence_SO=supercontig / SO=protein_coding / is_pseudo=false